MAFTLTQAQTYLGPFLQAHKAKHVEAAVSEWLVLQCPQTDGTVGFWWPCRPIRVPWCILLILAASSLNSISGAGVRVVCTVRRLGRGLQVVMVNLGLCPRLLGSPRHPLAYFNTKGITGEQKIYLCYNDEGWTMMMIHHVKQVNKVQTSINNQTAWQWVGVRVGVETVMYA